MIINNLIINNLRIHEHSNYVFDVGINVIYGLNGTGKTTILEAISIASLSKSFLPVTENSLINYEQDFYYIKLDAKSDLEIPYNIKIENKKGKKKHISGSEGDNLVPKDIIGNLPTVVLTPDFKNITFGSPSDRREFLDKILSQSSKRYIESYLKMKRSLKQRNNLLNNRKNDRKLDKPQLDAWTDLFIRSSADVVLKRNNFISQFKPYFKKYYKYLSNGKENVDLQYKPNYLISDDLEDDSLENIIENYYNTWFETREEELIKGTTQFGPQKDELKVVLDKGTAKDVASQGQHKSLLISLKFAEFQFLKDKKKETPVFIFDDIFAELDHKRSEQLLKLLNEHKAQTFITVTDTSLIKDKIDDKSIKHIRINE